MKKLLLLLLCLVVFSCGKSKEEQMHFDYEDQVIRDYLNVSATDLNYKLISLNEVRKIKGSDSALFFLNKFRKKYKAAYDFELTPVYFDSLINIYSQGSIACGNLAKLYLESNYSKYSENRDKQVKYKSWSDDVTLLKNNYDNYSKVSDTLISSEYLIKYSIDNPILNNLKQTHEKYYYTDAAGSKFVRSEAK